MPSIAYTKRKYNIIYPKLNRYMAANKSNMPKCPWAFRVKIIYRRGLQSSIVIWLLTNQICRNAPGHLGLKLYIGGG